MSRVRPITGFLGALGLAVGLFVGCSGEPTDGSEATPDGAVGDSATYLPGAFLGADVRSPPDGSPLPDGSDRDAVADASDALSSDASDALASDASDASDAADGQTPCGAAEARLCNVGEPCAADGDCTPHVCTTNVCSLSPTICPRGTYADPPGGVVCTPCADSFTNAAPGSTSAADCTACPGGRTSSSASSHRCIHRLPVPSAGGQQTGTSCVGANYVYARYLVPPGTVTASSGATYAVQIAEGGNVLRMTWGVGGGPVVNGLALSTGVRLSAHTTRPSCGPGSSGVRDWVHLASPAADVEYWDPATRELQVRVSGGRVSAGGYVSSLTTTLFAVVVP